MLKTIAVGIGCALSFSALADGAPELRLLAQQRDAPALFESRPADEAQLAQLRGRLAAPPALHETGVILWDEPRTGVPPSRSAHEPAPGSGVSAAASIHRR